MPAYGKNLSPAGDDCAGGVSRDAAPVRTGAGARCLSLSGIWSAPVGLLCGGLAALITGLLALWAAVGSPLAELDHHLLTAHMAQHLLLMTVAAPLILLGLSARALPGGIIRPVICWFAGTATVIAWHVPALFELGMRSAAVACIRTWLFFRRRHSVLVARHPALAEPRECAHGGASLCTFSWRRYRATRCPRFLRFVAALFIRITFPRIGSSIFHLSQTRNAQAR